MWIGGVAICTGIVVMPNLGSVEPRISGRIRPIFGLIEDTPQPCGSHISILTAVLGLLYFDNIVV